MPFMIGPAPIRRTVQYLEKGNLIFRDAVRIFLVHYNSDKNPTHQGVVDFLFWHLGQIQYKNPNVQVVYLRNMTPTAFIRCWLDNGQEILMDVDNKSKDDILSHVQKILGKPKQEIEKAVRQQEIHPGYFGPAFARHCICEIPGQVPCPAIVPLPKHMRGKYRNMPDEDQ